MARTIAFRPVTPEDVEFLYSVYASTRAEELSVLPWDETQKESFLRMQFRAQHDFYREQFPQARFDIILMNRKPIGRLYLEQRQDEIRIIDIALLTKYRGRGIGSGLMREILAQGQNAGLPVRIHVEKNNKALRLYYRLGFREIEDQGVYCLMEWVPVPGSNRGLVSNVRHH